MIWFWVIGAVAAAGLPGCGTGVAPDGEGRDSEGDGIDTSLSSEDGSDSAGRDTTPDGGEAFTCLGSISGRVRKDGDTGMEAVVAVCIGPRCFTPAVSNSDGTFRWLFPLEDGESCGMLNIGEDALHFEISALNSPEAYATYSFLIKPTQAEISDLGPDDFDLNLGNLSLFALPETYALYDPDTGVSVDLDGVRIEIPAGGIVKRVVDIDEPVDHVQEIKVLRAPLEKWSPPFADIPLSALYFISPRWAKTAGDGISLSIELPAGADGGALRVFLLGGFVSNYGNAAVRDRADFIYRTSDGGCVNTDATDGLTEIEDGVFADCGEVEIVEGRVVTPPVPRFTWIGLSVQ